MALEGLHHITAITADAPRNVDFYARLLGLRLVKKTVNFDQPDVYHLYYGDEVGTPGLDPDVLRVPRRRARAGRRRRRSHDPVARRLRRRDRVLASPPGRGRRRRRARRRATCRSPTRRAWRTSSSSSTWRTPRSSPRPPTSRPSTRCSASRASGPTPARRPTAPGLLERLGMQPAEPDGVWVAEGAERHALLRYDAPPAGRGRQGAGQRPPHRVERRRRRGADGVPAARHRGRRPSHADHRPPVLPLGLLPRAERRPVRAGLARHRVHLRRAGARAGAQPEAAAAVRVAPSRARGARWRPAGPAGRRA